MQSGLEFPEHYSGNFKNCPEICITVPLNFHGVLGYTYTGIPRGQENRDQNIVY